MVYLREELYGTFLGETVKKYTWLTEGGFSVSVVSYGACITNIMVPDKNGQVADVALGFDDLEGYVKRNDPHCLGAVVGRCMGRVAHGRFQIDGVHYQLSRNLDDHHLHGGFMSFDKVNWQPTVDGTKVTFSYLSRDGEEGYPGDLVMNVAYNVSDDGTLHIEYTATTTKKTIVNPTNHSYFNLAGHESGSKGLYEHMVTLNCDRIIEGYKDWIPTGRILPVGGTPFDLRTPRRLGDVIDEDVPRFHHNLCVATHGNKEINFVARAVHPSSGRFMEVYSDQPGLLFFTSYYMPSRDEAPIQGKAGAEYRRHAGFCMETQNYVDAINHPNFPSPILKPGEVYKQRTKYTFGVVKNIE